MEKENYCILFVLGICLPKVANKIERKTTKFNAEIYYLIEKGINDRPQIQTRIQ